MSECSRYVNVVGVVEAPKAVPAWAVVNAPFVEVDGSIEVWAR